MRNQVDTAGCLVIVDEAHNFRTEIKKSMEIDDKGNEVEVVKTDKRGYKLSETATKQCFTVILLNPRKRRHTERGPEAGVRGSSPGVWVRRTGGGMYAYTEGGLSL